MSYRLIFPIALLSMFMGASALWLAAVPFTRPSIQAAWIDGIYNRKIAAAERFTNGRVIIIGGSGAHYGYSAQQVAHLSGLPTVNMGTHAGLGMPYILDRAKQILKPGDFAILAIEPTLNWPDRPSSVLAEYVVRYDRNYLLRASLRDAISIIYGMSPSDVIQEQARRLVPWTAKIGRSETVSNFGDETLSLSTIQTDPDRKALALSGPFPAYSADSDHPPKSLKDFLVWASNNKVRVGLAWTPVLNNDAYVTAPYQAYFNGITQWYLRGDAIQLGTATEYFQPIENMFDFIFHTNERGRMSASQTLARHLCEIVECRKPPTLPQGE